MWKTFLTFVVHRALLLIPIYFALDHYVAHKLDGGQAYFQHSSRTGAIQAAFLEKVKAQGEIPLLLHQSAGSFSDVLTITKNPYLCLQNLVVSWTNIDPVWSLVILSNLFLLLFYRRLYRLLTRMVVPETATTAAVLAVLLPTSFQLGLGSQSAFVYFLLTLAIFGTIDNRWLTVGISLALLALTNVTTLVVVPLLLFIFFYYQRHAGWRYMLQRGAFFLAPLILVAIWDYGSLVRISDAYAGSALKDIQDGFLGSQGVGSLFDKVYLGDFAMAVFLGVGALASVTSNTYLVDRLIPIYVFGMFLLYVPYREVSEQASFAAVCLQGIAAISRRLVIRIMCAVMIGFSIYLAVIQFN